jgi:hypothetical protein
LPGGLRKTTKTLFGPRYEPGEQEGDKNKEDK